MLMSSIYSVKSAMLIIKGKRPRSSYHWRTRVFSVHIPNAELLSFGSRMRLHQRSVDQISDFEENQTLKRKFRIK